jgi:hypothetical protein
MDAQYLAQERWFREMYSEALVDTPRQLRHDTQRGYSSQKHSAEHLVGLVHGPALWGTSNSVSGLGTVDRPTLVSILSEDAMKHLRFERWPALLVAPFVDKKFRFGLQRKSELSNASSK